MTTEGNRRLAAEVTRRGLSERAAARIVACTCASMHRYLKDGRVPTGEIAHRIGRAFGFDPELFYVAATDTPKRKRSPRSVAA